MRAKRHDVFLEEKLERVGYRLEEPEGPDAIRSRTVLDQRASPALDPDHDRSDIEQRADNDGNLEDGDGDVDFVDSGHAITRARALPAPQARPRCAGKSPDPRSPALSAGRRRESAARGPAGS